MILFLLTSVLYCDKIYQEVMITDCGIIICRNTHFIPPFPAHVPLSPVNIVFLRLLTLISYCDRIYVAVPYHYSLNGIKDRRKNIWLSDSDLLTYIYRNDIIGENVS